MAREHLAKSAQGARGLSLMEAQLPVQFLRRRQVPQSANLSDFDALALGISLVAHFNGRRA